MFTKQKIAMLVAEFLGALILTMVVLTVMPNTAIAAGVCLGLLVVLLGGISGAVFNPAVTLGLWSVRKLQTYQALVYIAVQLLGGITAYALYTYISGNSLADNKVAKFDSGLMVAEAVGTAVLAMGYAAATYQNLLSGAKAFAIGGALLVGVVVANAQASAGYLNPATALGAHVLDLGNIDSWGNYVLGPILGAVIGFNLYNLLFAANVPAAVSAVTTAPVRTNAVSKTAPRASATKKTVKKKR